MYGPGQSGAGPGSLRIQATEGITRGVCRFLRSAGYTVLREFRLKSKRRADVTGLDGQGKFVIVEVKSSAEDFRSDQKWLDYGPHCDAFYFAVSENFPLEILPQQHGLIVADAYGAEILRPAPVEPMNGNRRRLQLLNFARAGADRLERHLDGAGVRNHT
ncbi:MAG: MmcB family DNA repair protein [Rhodospirillales bacterium]|nr:MmcB family DNA repair protein [Rhodospirillales bacterium]